MATNLSRKILTVTEPSIQLDSLEIPDAESGTKNSEGLSMKEKPSKMSSLITLVRINQYEVQQDRIRSLRIKSVDFYPTIRIVFIDRDGMFMSRFFPMDGDIIQVNIRSQGTETTFKPLRMDFEIVDIQPAGGGSTESAARFIVDGRLRVPNLFTDSVQYNEGTSWDSLLNISENLQLGYASNIEDTNDAMSWINPNDTTENYIKSILKNSYLNDDSFFTAYIDPYYYLNFVEVNRLFVQDDEIDASQTFSQNAGDLFGDSDGESNNFPDYLTNMFSMQGGARYISKYHMVNESGAINKNNGYKKYSQYWDLEEREFISEYVDPLTTNTPGMISSNKGRVINGESEGPRDQQIKYVYQGLKSENTHDEYMYSLILNEQNLLDVKKMGMIIELDTMNPSLIRYNRIFCLIYEYGSPQKTVLRNPFPEGQSPEPNAAERDVSPELDAQNTGIINEFLTGFYVIHGIEYFQTAPGGLRMRLHLQRREFKPST